MHEIEEHCAKWNKPDTGKTNIVCSISNVEVFIEIDDSYRSVDRYLNLEWWLLEDEWSGGGDLGNGYKIMVGWTYWILYKQLE